MFVKVRGRKEPLGPYYAFDMGQEIEELFGDIDDFTVYSINSIPYKNKVQEVPFEIEVQGIIECSTQRAMTKKQVAKAIHNNMGDFDEIVYALQDDSLGAKILEQCGYDFDELVMWADTNSSTTVRGKEVTASFYGESDCPFPREELDDFADAVMEEIVETAETELTDMYVEERGRGYFLIIELTDLEFEIAETVEVKLPPSGSIDLLMRKVPKVAKEFEDKFLDDTEMYASTAVDTSSEVLGGKPCGYPVASQEAQLKSLLIAVEYATKSGETDIVRQILYSYDRELYFEYEREFKNSRATVQQKMDWLYSKLTGVTASANPRKVIKRKN